jgi:hypothetical protein
MTTNPYINNWTFQSEQQLLSDIVAEAIQMYGMDMYYLPRTSTVDYDDVWKQDDMSQFNAAYTLEMYIKNIDSFDGEGSFLSKFGLEIRDRVNLSISTARFQQVMGAGTAANLPRPREGDVIFFPMTNKLFEIIYVDNRAQFYPLGSLPLFDIACEVFEYNGEVFNTGVSQIDSIASSLSINRDEFAELNANGQIQYDDGGNIITIPGFDENIQDVDFDNFEIEAEANTFVDFSDFDPFSRGTPT